MLLVYIDCKFLQVHYKAFLISMWGVFATQNSNVGVLLKVLQNFPHPHRLRCFTVALKQGIGL